MISSKELHLGPSRTVLSWRVSAVQLFFVLFLTLPASGLYAQNIRNGAALPESISFGEIREGDVIEKEIEIRNPASKPLYFQFLTTCPCVTLKPNELTIEPGSNEVLRVSFNSRGYRGKTIKKVFISSSVEKYHGSILDIEADVTGVSPDGESSGKCLECEEREQRAYLRHLQQQKENAVTFSEFFYSPGCRECEEFLKKDLPDILDSAQNPLVVVPQNIMDAQTFEQFLNRTEAINQNVVSLPALIINDKAYSGIPDIKKAVERATAAKEQLPASENIAVSEQAPGKTTGMLEQLAPIPIFAAGLVDGINPCAFTTIIFMLSLLTLHGRSRRDMLWIGIVFAFAVFCTYYLLGLGLFSVIRQAAAYSIISDLIRWVLLATLIVFAGISVYDGIMLRRGKTEKVVLQLSLSMKQRIHKSIRSGVKSASLLAGAAGMGVLVSIFELACTGQVYLPVITYMVSKEYSSGYFLLLLYNIGFILPLLTVFGLVYSGTGSKAISTIVANHMAKAKFVMAITFLLLGTLLFL